MSSPVQDAVSTAPAKGVPGQQTSPASSTENEPGVNDEASAHIPFGVMMQQSAEGKFKLLSGNTNKLAGPAVFNHYFDREQQLDATGVLPDAYLSAGRKWRGWVLIEETVAVGDPVRVRHTAGGSEVAGAFRTSADSTDCFDISTFASWRTGGTATEGVAELEIDMSNSALADPD